MKSDEVPAAAGLCSGSSRFGAAACKRRQAEGEEIGAFVRRFSWQVVRQLIQNQQADIGIYI